MAYVNNGTARSLKITVDKQVGGNQVAPERIYNGQLAGSSWGNPSYLVLTDLEMQQLSTADFNTRYADFVAYVESVESGLDFGTDIVGDGATKYDPYTCLATTTTTQTTVAPVYAFSIKYGQYPVDVCSGTVDLVYSNVSSPVAGTTLYKDVAMTTPWNTVGGEHVLFVSPVIHGQLAVEVSISTGVIAQITTFDCGGVTPPVTTTTTTAAITYWYTLYRCDTGVNYKIGPYASSSLFSTGMRVEGASGVYYTVATVAEAEPAYSSITAATWTGFYGCP